MSPEGRLLLEGFEKFSPEVYDDGFGFATIGYGHRVRPGEQFDLITEEQGDDILSGDIEWAENCVGKFVKCPISQN